MIKNTNITSKDKIDIEAFEQDDNIFYVELPRGFYNINNEKVSIEYSNNKVILEDIQNINITQIKTTKEIDYYVGVNGNKMSQEEYKEKLKVINLKYNHLEEEWDDLDSEYLYKKFIKSNKPIYRSITTETPISFNINSTPPIDCRYITPMRKLNGDLKNTIYIYDKGKHIKDLVLEVFNKYGYSLSNTEYTKKDEIYFRNNNNTIRFSVFGDSRSYLTISIKELKKYEEITSVQGVYKSIFDNYNDTIKSITAIVEMYFKSQIKLKDIKVVDLLDKLTYIKGTILSLDVKQKELTRKNSLTISIEELIKDVKESITNNKQKGE